MAELESILSEHPFFDRIDPIYLRILGGCASEASFKAGDVIFRQGEEAVRFYLIREGRVALEFFSSAREAITIETISEGDILGDSWLFPPYLCHCDARAREATRAIAFNAGCLRGICDDDHDLGFELMKRFSEIMVKRLQAAMLQCVDIYRAPAKGRRP